MKQRGDNEGATRPQEEEEEEDRPARSEGIGARDRKRKARAIGRDWRPRQEEKSPRDRKGLAPARGGEKPARSEGIGARDRKGLAPAIIKDNEPARESHIRETPHLIREAACAERHLLRIRNGRVHAP